MTSTNSPSLRCAIFQVSDMGFELLPEKSPPHFYRQFWPRRTFEGTSWVNLQWTQTCSTFLQCTGDQPFVSAVDVVVFPFHMHDFTARNETFPQIGFLVPSHVPASACLLRWPVGRSFGQLPVAISLQIESWEKVAEEALLVKISNKCFSCVRHVRLM